MSYINDALRKAQKDKKSDYAAYEPIVSAADKKTSKTRKWFIIAGVAMLFLWAGAVVALLHRPEEKMIPAKTDLIAAREAIVAPAAPPLAEETALDVQKEAAPAAKPVPVEIPVVIKEEPGNNDAQALYAQAVQKQREGKLAEAKDLYKQIIKIDPKNIQALNNLGVVYMDQKVYKWAAIRLNDALKIKHDYPKAHYNLACLYAQQNNREQSLHHLQKAIGLNPEARAWAQNDEDFRAFTHLTEFKKLMEK
ncbi:MAG: tetratricopeptide repeat protein [Smithella sp.]|nr:tetratricopeptide repeat protein [Smithella sp.]